MELENFQRNKLPEMKRNWKKMAEERNELSNIAEQQGVHDRPEFRVLHEAVYAEASIRKRRSLLETARAYLAAREAKLEHLYEATKDRLEGYAGNILAKHKVGWWLEHIFGSGYSLAEIESFLNPDDGRFREIVSGWSEMRQQFDLLEQKRAQIGTPSTFHFVSLDVFLSKHFDDRQEYVSLGKMSFIDFEKEHPLMLDLRREMASQDWGSAQELIRKIRLEEAHLTDEQKQDLASMEQMVQRHLPQGNETTLPPSASVQETLSSMRTAIAMLPSSLQGLFIQSLQKGYDVHNTLYSIFYNRVWCRNHGYLDDHRERILKQTTTEETQEVVKEGHRDYGLENNDLNTYQQPAVRPYDGVWAPQILHCSPGSHGTLLSVLDSNKE